MLVCVAHLLYAWPCIAFPLLQIKHLCVFWDVLSPKALYGCVVLEEEEEEEEEEGNDVEVVWAKSARGVWGLGHVFDGKLYFTRDISEEKWIPKDLVSPKKLVAAPKARAKAAPQPRAKPAAKRTGLAVQAGAKAAAKPAPRASSSSASATHPVPVMQTEHVQQFKVCYSRTQKFFTVPLDPQ